MRWVTEKAGAALRKAATGAVALLFFLLIGSQRLQANDIPPEELKTAEQIRQLTGAQAAGHYPVKMRGVVTFFDEAIFMQFIQDETAGIYLQQTNNQPRLLPGQLV